MAYSVVASYADVLRLVTRGAGNAEERVTSPRTSAWEANSVVVDGTIHPTIVECSLLQYHNHYNWLSCDPGMGSNFSKCHFNRFSFSTLFTDSSLQVPVQPVVFSSPRQENQDNQRG